jgi:anti-anti-sigma factor
MEIVETTQGDVVVLTLTSETISGPEIGDFHSKIKGLVRDGFKKVVVNLENVRWFGSAMLGALVASLTTLRNSGGDLRLANTARRVESIFAATQLASLFSSYESVDRAVSSYIVKPI